MKGELAASLAAPSTAQTGAPTIISDPLDKRAINRLEKIVKERDEQLSDLTAYFEV